MKQAAAGPRAPVFPVENHARDEHLTWVVFALNIDELSHVTVDVHRA